MKTDFSPQSGRGALRRALRAPRVLGGLAMIVLAGSNLYWLRSTMFDRPSAAVLRWLSAVSGGVLNETIVTLGSCLLLGMGIVLLVVGITRLLLIDDR